MEAIKRSPEIFDTTFRDGAQGKNLEITSMHDFLETVKAIDDLGIVKYLELGFALASNGNRERIRAAQHLHLQAEIVAFGRTHKDDVRAILDLGVKVATLVGKSRVRDAEQALKVTPEENLKLIEDSIKALVAEEVEVIYDAEHFFAGFKEDENYAFNTLITAQKAGAKRLVLCDTTGSCTTEDVRKIIRAVKFQFAGCQNLFGVHFHNDRGRALANSEAAWEEGIDHIQGVFGGFGERTGNLDLCTLIPNLYSDYQTDIDSEKLKQLTNVYHLVCNVFGTTPYSRQPWVGESAFYTEAGMHESGGRRDPGSYLHADPSIVGNSYQVGLTDQSGKANILSKAEAWGIKVPEGKIGEIVSEFNKMIDDGYTFLKAEASFRLYLMKKMDLLPNYFSSVFPPEPFSIVADKANKDLVVATLEMNVGNNYYLESAKGDGPINALENCLRAILIFNHPEINKIKMVDFKIFTLDMSHGSAAKVRAQIKFSKGKDAWTTIGISTNWEKAAWEALFNGYFYFLAMEGLKNEATSVVEKNS
jgi:2-isopropylmalate synthase